MSSAAGQVPAPVSSRDLWLRRLLGAPGVLLDVLEPRPTHPPSGALTPVDVWPMVRAGARWPEAALALEEDLHYHLHDDDVLAYQRRRGTAFAIGGLNSGDVEGLLRTFASHAGHQGLRRMLVFPVRETQRAAVHAAGFSSVQVGVEAWLDLAELSFRGRRYESVRQMRNRARRRGVTSEEVPQTGLDDVRDELAAIHASWLAGKRPSWRMKLLVGSPGLEQPFDRRYLVARTAQRIEAFCTLLPGADGQWGVDVMCRRPDAVRGAMEHLLMHAVEQLRAEGAETLSLGPCPMAGVDRGEHALERVFRGLYASSWGNQLFGFRNLHRFKSKFRPRWEPVYFASSPRLGVFSLYAGCRMWGLY